MKKDQKMAIKKAKKAAETAGQHVNGLSSSLVFTPVQGIELVNPTANKDSKEGTETYFTKTAAFFKNSF